MRARDFVYWLQGYFELTDSAQGDRSEAALKGAAPISAETAAVIKRHLSMVFIHEIDPAMGPPAHQAALTAAHQGKLNSLAAAWPRAEELAKAAHRPVLLEDLVVALGLGGGATGQPPKCLQVDPGFLTGVDSGVSFNC